jgi:hypothetical protein
LSISSRLAPGSQAYVGVVLCAVAAAAGGAAGDPPAETPTGGFLSSLKQAINKDFDHEVVRGHFDVGEGPEAHRYYCLVDAKTGKRESNGVVGQPFIRPDGMTGVKGGAVSFYSCANAEQRGTLVTTGYVLSAAAAAGIASVSPASPAPRPAELPAPQSAPPENAPPAARGIAEGSVDVAALRLGMSPDQVRAVLKSKNLLDYHESAQILNEDPATRAQLPAGGRFVNTMAAWTSAQRGDASVADGESYEIMFTPVPGNERVMSIVHSVSYSTENAVPEMAFASGLVKKYGGYTGADLPNSPTWRTQRGNDVQVGDSCNRRAVVGGLRELDAGTRATQNLALKTTPEEFQYQIDHCGVAIVTEDHVANGSGPRQDRTIARYTVTAYSPSIGLDGVVTAMQLMQTARNTADNSKAPRVKPRVAPNL